MANLFYTFYEDNIEDNKIDFLTSGPVQIVNMIEHILRFIAPLIFLFGSSSKFFCEFADSIDGPIGHGNLAVGHLGLGFIWPITAAMELICSINSLITIRKKHEIKSCLMLLLIMKYGDKDVSRVEKNFGSCMGDYFSVHFGIDFTKKQLDETYDSYRTRVEDIIEKKLKTRPDMLGYLIQQAKGYTPDIDPSFEFANDVNQDWSNHLHQVKREKAEVILKAVACFFAILPLVAECFEYSVKIGIASNWIVNYTLWLAPIIFWLGFPILVIFTFVKLGVALYDHIALIRGNGCDGEEFFKSIGGKNGWDELSWWEKVYKPFMYKNCNLALSYAVILCRAGIIFSILATGTLISMPVAGIISAILLLGITLAYFIRYCVGLHKNWGHKALEKRNKLAAGTEMFVLTSNITSDPLFTAPSEKEEDNNAMPANNLPPVRVAHVPTGKPADSLCFH